MTIIDPRSPCIVGIGRATWRDDHALEPVSMWAEVAARAATDAGLPSILSSIDSLHLVHCMSWTYDDAAQRLGELVGAAPGFAETSVLAGTAGQRLVNSAAERMLAGSSELALVVGGEALNTRRRLSAAGLPMPWSHPAEHAPSAPINLDEWVSPTEWAHDVLQPSVTFAALDSALQAASGRSPEEHVALEGRLLSGLSAVAARNEHAWFPVYRPPEEVTTVTDTNRMISSPYAKYMVAIMDVDMAAALLMTTHRKADELGIPADQRVYVRGWSFGRDATHLAGRASLSRSRAMELASRDALQQAGIGIDDVAHLDLYSCFASSVLFATNALGIDSDDARGLTVTGGLPYHGGPASNYTTHAIAEMVTRLRGNSQTFGLVNGVGMHMTKHVWAVYGSEPGPVAPPDYDEVQRQIDLEPGSEVLQELTAPLHATIAAATTTFGRDGSPSSALVIADVTDDVRAYARTTDPELIGSVLEGAAVGQAVTLRPVGNGAHDVTLRT